MLTTNAIDTVVRAALDEDAPWGDVTSEVLIPADAVATAQLVAREAGVFSGGDRKSTRLNSSHSSPSRMPSSA